MYSVDTEGILRKIANLDKISESVSRAIHRGVLEGGQPARRVADFLHGTWLGHPLHSVLTDFTIGAWVLGAVFDLLSLGGRSQYTQRAADKLTELGTISAVPTALAGLADYSTAPKRVMATGAAHGLLNGLVLILYLASINLRKQGNRGAGLFFSMLAGSLLMVSAWLGGELAYRYRVGVNKITSHPQEPKEWMPVIDQQALAEGLPKQVQVEGEPVLLYRRDGRVYAIGAVCAHEGGPLDQGAFQGHHVECPWHQSVYDLRDGGVVHGPATYAVPGYETRIRNGQVEIRLKESQLPPVSSAA